MSIGLRVKEQRKKLKLTQQELATKISMSLDFIKKLETNRLNPSLETLDKLCVLFDVSSDYLLCKIGTNEENRMKVIREYEKLSPDKKKIVDDIIQKITDERKDKGDS